MFSEAYCKIKRPVDVSPVKATFAILGDCAKGFPASTPKPLITFTTPAGGTFYNNSIRTSKPTGVCSAGFITTVQPAAKAGQSFHAAIKSGKFQGII